MTLDETDQCAYCGSLVVEHDPVSVRSHPPATDDPSYFCNYACLAAHIDANDLQLGAACSWEPDS